MNHGKDTLQPSQGEPKVEAKKRGERKGFTPHIITYEGRAFNLYMALTGLDIESAGRAPFPSGEAGPLQLLKDSPEVLASYMQGHHDEATASLKHAGITAGERTGLPKDKDKDPNMLKTRRENTIAIIREHEKQYRAELKGLGLSDDKIEEMVERQRHKPLPVDVSKKIESESYAVISRKQHKTYMEAAVARQKYALRGTGENDELEFSYNKRKKKIVVKSRTSKRGYPGYALLSNPEEAKRIAERAVNTQMARDDELLSGSFNAHAEIEKQTDQILQFAEKKKQGMLKQPGKARKLAERIVAARIKALDHPIENPAAEIAKKTAQVLDLGNVMGNASSVTTTDGKRGYTVRSAELNGAYRDDWGAYSAGIADVQVDEPRPGERRKGIIPITRKPIQKNIFQEGRDENGIKRRDIRRYNLNGIVADKVRKHDEAVGDMELAVDEETATENMLRNAAEHKPKILDEFPEGNFFFIDDDPKAQRVLLTEVDNPAPPTHAGGDIINAGRRKYRELLEEYKGDAKRAFTEAETWVLELAAETDANFDRMDRETAAYWRANNNANWKAFVARAETLPRTDPESSLRANWDVNYPPKRVDPRIVPERQGRKGAFKAIRMKELVTETQAKRTMLNKLEKKQQEE